MELWRAEAGSGKTEAVVGLIADAVCAQRLARIWVVLPTSRQRTQFRERLLERLLEANLPALNVELFNFFSLNRRLLNLMRVPVRSLRGGARQAVLRRVAVAQTLKTFGDVAAMPGFSRAVGDLISELKQSRIEPEAFLDAFHDDKDDDLARIYDAYQSLLRDHDLVDTEGEAWLALESLNATASFDPKIALLVVDGFDQFTPVQAQMIQALDLHAGRTVVTLTHVPDRDDGVGRRFVSAQAALGDVHSIILDGYNHPLPCVNHLLRHAFQPGGQPRRMNSAAAQTLTLIEAHSPSAEAAEIMRHIKRRLVIDKVPPDSIMIAVRDWGRYQPALSAAAREFGVPVSLQAGAPLTRHPLAALLDSLLSLPDTGFAFEMVLDVLRSPYIRIEGLPPALIGKVEQAARKFNLRSGRDAWDLALEQGARPGQDYRGRETPPILSPDEYRDASEALQRLFDVTPPADNLDSVWGFVQRIEDIIGPDPDHPTDSDIKVTDYCLHIAERVRRNAAINDDLAALRAIKDALQELLLTEDLLTAVTDSGGRAMFWGEFLADFRAALSGMELSASPDRSGRVLVTTATDARGSAHAHVFVPGLSEGIFPAPLRDDPLYLDSERRRSNSDGEALLRTSADRADDDALFFELIAQARDSLTLSRPSMNSGQAWPASALWNGVIALLSDSDVEAIRIRITPGRPPNSEEAASLPELAASAHTAGASSLVLQQYIAAHDKQRAAHIAHAQSIERARAQLAENRACDEAHEFTGNLTAPEYAALTAYVRSPSYQWSASAINTLGSCAYRIFAEKLLKLEKLEDPEEGANAKVEGDLMHLILETTYKAFQTPERAISPGNVDTALALLKDAAHDVFENAVRERLLAPSAIWEQQQKVIVRYLSEMVRRDFSADSPVAKSFGTGVRWTLVTEATIGYDPGRPLILSIDTDDGTVSFQFGGKIDRIDCLYDGETLRLVVVDYKRSGMTDSKDIAEGRSTQTVLYSAALRKLLGDPHTPEHKTWFRAAPQGVPIEIAGGLFWSIRSGKSLHVLAPGGVYTVNKIKYTADELAQLTLQGIAARIAKLRTGDFRPLPEHPDKGSCGTFCPFRDLCRVCELMS